jgi:hypothetical protein
MRRARFLFAILLLAPTGSASAQAWLPDKGSGGISLQYQNDLVRDHALGWTQVDNGHIKTHEAIADIVYGFTDRIAVRFSLPYIVSKYNGPKGHVIEGLPKFDNGHYHGTFQDVRLDLRYAISPNHSVAVTPFVTAIVPSHQYVYFAHSGAGSDLQETQVGSYVARTLDPIAPQLFVQTRVAYGFVHPMLGISHNRAYLDLELGYAVRPGVRMFLVGTAFTTHGGISYPPPPAIVKDVLIAEGGLPYWQHHDQIGHEQQANLGVGGAVELTRSLDLFGSIGTNMIEVNGHVLAHGLSVGMTWHFSRNDVLGDFREEPRKMVARCVCGKAR